MSYIMHHAKAIAATVLIMATTAVAILTVLSLADAMRWI
jgi:hypothetical protein